MLVRALDWSEAWLRARKPELSAVAACMRFCIIGMGKLASRELSFGSDLDLIFVFDLDAGAGGDRTSPPRRSTRRASASA